MISIKWQPLYKERESLAFKNEQPWVHKQKGEGKTAEGGTVKKVQQKLDATSLKLGSVTREEKHHVVSSRITSLLHLIVRALWVIDNSCSVGGKKWDKEREGESEPGS